MPLSFVKFVYRILRSTLEIVIPISCFSTRKSSISSFQKLQLSRKSLKTFYFILLHILNKYLGEQALYPPPPIQVTVKFCSFFAPLIKFFNLLKSCITFQSHIAITTSYTYISNFQKCIELERFRFYIIPSHSH